MVAPLARQAGSTNILCDAGEETITSPISSSYVPFKWEEAPGKPICNESTLIEHHDTSDNPLQLPPRLQLQTESLLWKKSHQKIPFKSHHFTKLYKSMQRASKRRHFQIMFGDKDTALIDDTNESDNEFAISIDKLYPSIRIYEDLDDVLNHCDDRERKWCSPQQTLKSPLWYPRILGQRGSHHRDNVHERLSKAQKTSHIPTINESLPTLTWTNFDPNDEDTHKSSTGNVASMMFKDIIKRTYKFQKKKDVNVDIWSPTLATYLYNQQKMEEEESNKFPYISQNRSFPINGHMYYRSKSLKCYFEDHQEPRKAIHKSSLSYDDKYGQFDNSINTKGSELKCKGKCTVSKTVHILVSLYTSL